MKTVLIFGSPRPQGNTAAMAERFCAALGGETVQYNAYTAGIMPCIACDLCAREAKCVHADRGADLLAALDAADVIVIASPVHFSDLPGPLVSMAGRLQYLWNRRFAGDTVLSVKPRRGVILLSGGGSGKPDRALANARCYLHVLGAEITDEILSLKTDTLPASADANALAQIDAAAKKMKEIYHE